MARLLIGASAALLAAAQIVPPGPTCAFTQRGSTYDLSSVASPGEYYAIVDSRNDASEQPYTYLVSFCSDMVPPVAQFNGNFVNCTSTCDDGRQTCHTNNAPAFQVCSTGSACGSTCHRLGDTYKNGQFAVDSWNPSHGFSLSYSNGDVCNLKLSNGTTIVNPRAININFRCADVGGLLPAQDLINEMVTCGYFAVINSKLGCPTQCLPNTGAHVCNNNGVCDFDTDAGVSRCFCDAEWSGPYCTMPGDAGLPPKQSYGGNIAGGFFGGLFTGAAIVAIWAFVLTRLRGVSYKEAFFGIFPGGSGGSYSAAPSDAAASHAVYDYPAATAAAEPAGGSAGFYVPPPADNQGPLLA